MKLTKGKISKLLTKRKQTKKKFHKKQLNTNSKTFRRTKPTNLIHRTLKRFHGGAPNPDSTVSGASDSYPTTSSSENVPVQDDLKQSNFEDYSDNATLANAFKILADYVAKNLAERLANGSIPSLVNAAQIQGSVEFRPTFNSDTTPSAPPKEEEIGE
jgi:hypothetical protein